MRASDREGHLRGLELVRWRVRQDAESSPAWPGLAIGGARFTRRRLRCASGTTASSMAHHMPIVDRPARASGGIATPHHPSLTITPDGLALT